MPAYLDAVIIAAPNPEYLTHRIAGTDDTCGTIPVPGAQDRLGDHHCARTFTITWRHAIVIVFDRGTGSAGLSTRRRNEYQPVKNRSVISLVLKSLRTLLMLLPAVALGAESSSGEVDIGRRLLSYLPRKETQMGQAPDCLRDLATAMIREHLPREYEDKRHWGQTAKVLDGWHVRLDGLELRTKRRWKMANHGTWKRYRITQIDPDRHLTVSFHDIRQTDDGRTAFRVELTSRVHAFAQLTKWKYGLRLASVSVEADADVMLSASFLLATKLDITKIPPDVILQPEVTDAKVTLRHFEVRRISKIDGEFAEELGQGLRRLVEAKIEDDREKLVAKINAKIAKKQDKLRFSIHDIVSDKWEEWTSSSGGSTTAQPILQKARR
jgi:hypothetical protein